MTFLHNALALDFLPKLTVQLEKGRTQYPTTQSSPMKTAFAFLFFLCIFPKFHASRSIGSGFRLLWKKHTGTNQCRRWRSLVSSNRWSAPGSCRTSRDVHLLANGNILYHDTWTTLKEINLAKKEVWSYDCGNSNGNVGKPVGVHAFGRLLNGNTRIVESKAGRVIEVNRDGMLIRSFPLKPGGTQSSRWARETNQGTYLVCSEQPGVVTEYDLKTGKVVWEYLIKTRVYGAIRFAQWQYSHRFGKWK